MNCTKCNNSMEKRAGEDIGGFPGIHYWYCRSCGFSRAIVKKESKSEMRKRIQGNSGKS